MKPNNNFYLTTAISYPNGRPHMGHAYEVIATDAIARFHRLRGENVHFVTGTDEHGLKIAQAARAANVSPRVFVDDMVTHFHAMAAKLNISHDRFIRTTDADHVGACQALWRAMVANGDVYLDRYEGWYSVRDEAYYDDSELVEGQGADGATVRLSPQGTEVDWTVEESWFFRLSAYQDRLLAHFDAHPDFIQPPSRFNEMRAFVAGGLRDLSISRTSFDWGIPVPDAPCHVMYVWVDALANYLTAVGYPDGDFGAWWPADLHIIGKDVVRFHAIYWPAFLMSAQLALPKTIFGHGFVLYRGEKMSKSLGNVVEPVALADAFGVDQFRWFLLRDIAFGDDGNYSHEAIAERTNADLANGIGNLAQRSLSMVAKNCAGAMPQPAVSGDAEDALLTALAAHTKGYFASMDSLLLHRGLENVMAMVAAANLYFADSAPWSLAKTDPAAMAGVLGTTLDAVRRIAILVQPMMPSASATLLDQLGVAADARDFAALDQVVVTGTPLPAPQGVFPRWVEPKAS